MLGNRQSRRWIADNAPPSPRNMPPGESVYGDPYIPALSGIMTSQADGSATILPSAATPYARDDALFINTAFQYVNIVRLIPGLTYSVASPTVVPPGAVLAADGESLAYYGGSQPMPLTSAILAPTAGFTPGNANGQATSGVIELLSQTLGGYGTGSANQVIRGITIDGRAAPAGVNGIEAWGPVWGVKLLGCGIYGLPNFGIATSTSAADGTGKPPDLWYADRCHIAASGSDGMNTTGGLSDSYFYGCESTGNVGVGWNMTGANSRMIGCKAEFNQGTAGFRIISGGSGAAGNPGFWLEGCSTDHNYSDGVLIFSASGAGPISLDGCNLHGDGYQGGAGGGGFAGLRVSSTNARVLASGLRVLTVNGATPFPQYGVRNDGSANVVKVGGAGLVFGNVAATNNTSTGTLTVGADVLTGTGAWGT